MPRLPAIQSARSISAEATDPYNADSTAVTANNICVFFFEKIWKTTSKPSVADLQTNKFLPEKNDFT